MSGPKCRDLVAALAGTMRTESHIKTITDDCTIGVGESAVHVVRVASKSFLRYEVKMTAESLSPNLRYASGDQTWTEEFEVSNRRERVLQGELYCSGKFVDQAIKMTVSYVAIGCKGTEAANMQLLLDSGS
jgi:hypothetical protein